MYEIGQHLEGIMQEIDKKEERWLEISMLLEE
jgi:hypothetical protein